MDYIRKTLDTKKLSNVEFALLQLISENGELSGYEINKLVEERGYREWADIGETSIYSGLNKLHKKDLVEFYVFADKQGKGPLPKKFKLIDKGKVTLKKEILLALSATRERDRRFDIALAALPFIDKDEALHALASRQRFLSDESERITTKFTKQGGSDIPEHVQLLFKHPMVLIEAELCFLDEIINTLKAKQETNHDHF